jgi:GNAT superfamily N-acetyltransferase
MHIKPLNTAEEIIQSFEVFLELRPHLPEPQEFVKLIQHQQKEGYTLLALCDDSMIVSCAGFRIFSTLAWGKILYIDDLITKEELRGRGYGKALLNHLIEIGLHHACLQVHLDSGYTRHAAHKVYLKQGFELHAHHFALKLGFYNT